jgi:hypothetical protein
MTAGRRVRWTAVSSERVRLLRQSAEDKIQQAESERRERECETEAQRRLLAEANE